MRPHNRFHLFPVARHSGDVPDCSKKEIGLPVFGANRLEKSEQFR
jgi:hypothetical protein